MRIESLFGASSRRKAAGYLIGSALFFAAACMAAASIAIAARQSDAASKEFSPDLKAFVGTWRASYKDEVFAILVLKEQGGRLVGTLNNFDISVDKDGNLNDGTHKDQGEAPLLNVRLKSSSVTFVVMQKDQYYPSTEFTFAPKNAQQGELTPSSNNPPYAVSGAQVKSIPMTRIQPKL